MSDVAVIGGGAFGAALAITQAEAGRRVTLWARDLSGYADRVPPRLPSARLPDTIMLTGDLSAVDAPILLLAVPMQALGTLAPDLPTGLPVACCKGVDLATGLGPTGVLAQHGRTEAAVLTGPSFAVDIAAGLPTALTLAAPDEATAADLQTRLSTPTLRLYRGTDVIGAELGGALKNVIAIACGAAIGAGLGESARAALMTRGFAELRRYAMAQGAREQTLMGLSGMGDLVLTCGSPQSRNFSHGAALGAGQPIDRAKTVEGVATACAVAERALALGHEMPLTMMVDRLCRGDIGPDEAREALLARPLKEE